MFQEVVEEPATDGDSDHTEREGSLNTKNTCELIVLFFQCYMQYGNELGDKANILMYIHNISCLCVDDVYWYECTLLKLIHSFPESDGMNGTFN